MARRLWTRIVKDWENQPLAIIGQVLSLALAVFLAVWSSPSTSFKPAAVQPLADASFALAMTVLAASMCAQISRYGFRKGFVAGFCLSLILSSACLLLFAVLSAPYLAKTTKIVHGSYDGALMDVGYWAVFLIYAVTCTSSAIDSMISASRRLKSAKGADEEERGVTVLEVAIVAFVWGACLSGVQQKIVAAFVFQSPPVEIEESK